MNQGQRLTIATERCNIHQAWDFRRCIIISGKEVRNIFKGGVDSEV